MHGHINLHAYFHWKVALAVYVTAEGHVFPNNLLMLYFLMHVQ